MHIIFTSRTALFLFILPFQLKPVIAGDEVVCGEDLDGYHANPSDCYSAIALIPNGQLNPDPKNFPAGGKLDLQFAPFARDALYLVPAAFHSGTCVVTVEAYDSTTHGKPPLPTGVAFAMYKNMWPNVRTQATRIVHDCHYLTPGNIWKGAVITRSMLGDYPYPYHVRVARTPERWPLHNFLAASRIVSPEHHRKLNRYYYHEPVH
jgi:hypothetical protein